MMIELYGSFVIYILCLNRMASKIPFLTAIIFLLTVILTVSKTISADLSLDLFSFYGGYLFSIYGKSISIKKAFFMSLIGLYLAGAHKTSFSHSFISVFLGDFTYTLCNFVSGFLIVYAILYNDKFSNVFSWKIPVFMGKVSFSVYLIHMPILSTLGVFLFDVLFQSTNMYNFSAIIASILTIISIYVCSLLFYNLIDSKGMAISNHFAKYVISRIPALNIGK